MIINNTSKITQTSPNDHQQQLPPGKTPELLADFVNEQPMKVFKAFFTNSFINQVLLKTLLYNVKSNISNERLSIQRSSHNSCNSMQLTQIYKTEETFPHFEREEDSTKYFCAYIYAVQVLIIQI